MTLDYKILWIDDRKEFFDNHEEYISDHLIDKGFEPVIKKYESFSEFEQKESDAGHQKIYDLFLIDLNLDHGNTGDEIISKIRTNHILTDVVFYSTNLEDVRQKVNEENLEGIYVTSRNQDDFEEKVTDVIDVTIKKVQDVNNLRGLIMAEVAELDRLTEKIIILGSGKIADKAIEKYTLKKIKESGASKQNKAKRFLENIEATNFESLFNMLGFVDSDKKVKATGEILSKLGISEPITKDDFIEPYINDIIGKRNKFAHIEERDGVDENGKACKVIGDIPFTEEKCVNIRKDIKKYKKLLNAILETIAE